MTMSNKLYGRTVQLIFRVGISALIALCVTQFVYAQEAQLSAGLDWKLKRDRDGIRIYLSRVPYSKFKAIRSIMTVKGTPNSLVALVMDLPNCRSWAAMCREARIEQRLSVTDSYIYTRNNLPFPVRDLDIVALVKWTRDSITGKISMISRATTGLLPVTKGVIRIEQATSEWHFTPLDSGEVRVESYAHIDPNGAMPAWLTNILMVDSPYKTMKNMREIVQAGGYTNAQVAF